MTEGLEDSLLQLREMVDNSKIKKSAENGCNGVELLVAVSCKGTKEYFHHKLNVIEKNWHRHSIEETQEMLLKWKEAIEKAKWEADLEEAEMNWKNLWRETEKRLKIIRAVGLKKIFLDELDEKTADINTRFTDLKQRIQYHVWEAGDLEEIEKRISRWSWFAEKKIKKRKAV